MRDITVVGGATPVAGVPFTLKADLVNQGSLATGPFQVQWTTDGSARPPANHGSLAPGQSSTEGSTSIVLVLGAGTHAIRFTADPDAQVPVIERSRTTLLKNIVVKSALS